jgi:type VI secretion system secreted protein VgrG
MRPKECLAATTLDRAGIRHHHDADQPQPGVVMSAQRDRVYQIESPFGADVLLLRRMVGRESLSQAFEWHLDLLSKDEELAAEDILGQDVAISTLQPNGQRRYFHGVVSDFSQHGWVQTYNEYRAIVRPWFWLLTRTADCRIFQEKTIPDIFEEVVKPYGLTHYELRLSGSYEPWEYCVQYRETDFNFLSRLLEQEGIYYFFEHEKDKHTMVLADDPGAHRAREGYDKVPFYPPGTPDQQRARDHFRSWSYTKSVLPGAFATTDFDFEAPRKPLGATETISRRHEKADFEIYDYPAELSKLDVGQSKLTAKVRIEELQSTYFVAQGQGDAVGLVPGARFKLENHKRDDQNIEYLITDAQYRLASDQFETGGHTRGDDFSITIDAIEAKTPFRPERRTPKPVVQGAQTAMVVGKSGDEIYTDKHGRVKVQFHWDRYGKRDENSSCWIRVAQLWAGKTWGGIHIPRIGQEVIVSFLEGDPDQPIITGRVYNGDSMPPYGLPGNATQSGIKSRSSKGGSDANFNEIRFEDKKGSEQLYIHAEKNQDEVVENDETVEIGHDRTEHVGHDEKITIDNNRTEKVGVNEDITIGANRTEKVGVNETINIGANRDITVGKNETATVALMRTHTVGVNEAITVGASQEVTVGAMQAITVGANQTVNVGANHSLSIGSNRSVTVGSNHTVKVGSNETVEVGSNAGMIVGGDESHQVSGGRATNIGKDDNLTVAKNVVISAGDSVSIKTGDASITMKKDGTISIKGKDITIEGSGKISVKASGDIVMKGSKIHQN